LFRIKNELKFAINYVFRLAIELSVDLMLVIAASATMISYINLILELSMERLINYQMVSMLDISIWKRLSTSYFVIVWIGNLSTLSTIPHTKNKAKI